ncbi:MAG: hypothetical protein MUF09_11770 [Candidatus Nanopelagicales bacterium]|nr:hypothetical protein [Candidatus Nanopelagicales bacterium]
MVLATVVVAGALVLSGGPAMAGAPSTQAYTCTGGDFSTGNMVHIPSGNYSSLTVAGACDVEPDAVISIVGNLNVLAGAVFDAQSAPSTITVGRNVTAAAGSLLGLGCQPDAPGMSGHPCLDPYANERSTITVKGNVTATGADTVLLNGITVKGNVTLTGGGGDIPWSVKNNTIGRNLTVSEVTPFWFGALFNSIAGNATLTNITVTEDYPGASQAVYIVRNTIGRNLTCTGLGPNLSFGFYPGQVNTVGHNANGQCASPVST